MAGGTVLVTGASRGIGKAVALRFAKEHYNVAISCLRNTRRLEETKAEIEDLWARESRTSGPLPDAASGFAAVRENIPPACLAYTGDMGDMDCCREFFGMVTKRFGTPDILVNNAGISYIGLLQDMTCEEWDRVIRTNLTSAFHLCKLAIPGMVSRKSGKIIQISSVWGCAGASCEAAYSASKGGLNALTKALAKELAPSGIQVNAVACGAIDTEMNHFLNEEELEDLTDQIPAGRLGQAEEAAELVWQLSQANAYLTGQVIGLDGGWI